MPSGGVAPACMHARGIDKTVPNVYNNSNEMKTRGGLAHESAFAGPAP